jgi:outer membrane protein OmpA-like peptidoglycan-associated protein
VQDDVDDGNIYVSYYINEKWTPIKKLNKNINSKKWETHASVTPDGKTLYFASERKGGKGGFDIYYSKLDENGEWGKAVNLGDNINTKYDEDLPFIGADNTQLYFCSQGHENIGGYDIFKSEIINGEFQKPENIGLVLNSPRNDLFYVATQGNKFTFSKLAKDEAVVITEAPKLIAVNGEIINEISDKLPNEFNIKTDSLISNLSIDGDKFSFSAKKQNISFVITAKGFEDKIVNIDLSDYNETTKQLVVKIKPIPTTNDIATNNSTINESIPTNNLTSNTNTEEAILFDFNSAKIKDNYNKYLNNIAQIATDKKIEIYAYTDTKGSNEYNLKLSKQRAMSIKAYLINKGVPATNININPRGETSKFESDILNRRAEIKLKE